MIGAWRKLPALAQDAALALLTTLVTAGYPLLGAPSGHTFLWVMLVCAVCAPLALRRRLPLTASLVSGAVVVLARLLHQPEVGAWVTVAAFASAAYHRDHDRWLPAVAATCWLVALDLAYGGTMEDPSGLARSVAAGLAPVALGHILRLRHDQARQAELVRRAQERARIAREVHDVVGHHLSAIRLQAVGARRGTPADAGRALDVIAEISGTALGETRRLLGLLREEEHADTDLGPLLARLSRQGLRVRLDGDPLRDEVPPRIRYAVYRIVQESLTNVMRHSGVSHAVVRIRRRSGAVEATVEDDGQAVPEGPGAPGGPGVPEGGGLRGMRERAALLGGTLMAGPREPHGWRVTARFPLGELGELGEKEGADP
ncbi:sensor histidine kinase [Nonomuraea basaltis]|uniref:sensor histidine kinase n=1 Tax=Nonomuraea basaltis TaxID=2495887 RepID=UPI00110C6970|nr:histidine kinase [Nonomuraea basaltis]TMR93805.1 sensor histidine kinase [Nonomuraea basaltis]